MSGAEITFGQMLLQGWPVLSVLLLASILCWTFFLDRYRVFKAADVEGEAFVKELLGRLEREGLSSARRYCGHFTAPLAQVAGRVLECPGDRAARERVLRHSIQSLIRDWQRGVPVLGTIASVAPFIGLFGTIAGIIRAFRDIAAQTGSGPEVVAAGISEALVTTAAGLLVAIPAVIAFNYCIHRIQRLAGQLDDTLFPLIEALGDQDIPRSRL